MFQCVLQKTRTRIELVPFPLTLPMSNVPVSESASATVGARASVEADEEEEVDGAEADDPSDASDFEGEWGMFSASGEDEAESILDASRSLKDLERRMAKARHSEINDTAVRERLYEALEERWK
jgi:hypothetical protein